MKMKRFKDFVVENLVQESLDSKFDIKHHKELKDYVNNTSKAKIYPEHTAVMGSEHMQKQGMHVLRIMNKENEIEYHILNTGATPGKKLDTDKRDNKATLHAMKIIHDDAKFHLGQGRKVKIQSANDRQHKIYTGIANHLIKNDPDRKVSQLGMQPKTDGDGKAKTLMIESIFEGKSNWIDGFLMEKLEDIHGKVVERDELSKHLNKTQMNNLMNHSWHKTYASYGDNPTAYRVSKHPNIEGYFTVDAGHGVPRNKETFGDEKEIRHMVQFHFDKNKISNADLFHNIGDQRYPETGKRVWVWKRSHKDVE